LDKERPDLPCSTEEVAVGVDGQTAGHTLVEKHGQHDGAAGIAAAGLGNLEH
jgi:hypothetical protein